jgi:tetratricopeptide (TPR) repeat protein/DNA-binding CsgD family transcriptional regulator
MPLQSLYDQLRNAITRYERIALLQSIAEHLAPNDPASALEHAERALKIAVSLDKPQQIAGALRCRGRCLLALGDTDAAYNDFREAIRMFRNNENDEEMAATLLSLGNACAGRGEHRRAFELYRQSLEKSRLQADPSAIAKALQAIGNLFTAMGDHAAALEQYQEAHSVIGPNGTDDEIGIILCDMAITNAELRAFERSLDLFKKALNYFKAPESRLLKLRTLANIANIYYSTDQLDLAFDYAAQAMTYSNELDEKRDLVMAHSSIGLIHEKQGDLEAAFDRQSKALELLREINDHGLRLVVYLNAGNLFRKIRHPDTLQILNEVLVLARDSGDPNMEAQVHKVLAETYEEGEDLPQTIVHLKCFAKRMEEAQLREKQRAIAQLQFQFDVEQAEKEKEIYRLKSERLESEIGDKNARIDNLINDLVERGKFNDMMYREVQKIANRCNDNGVQPLIDKLLANLRETKSSPEYQQVSEQLLRANGDFTHRLSKRYPTLTPTEIIICILLRHRKPCKNIADSMHIALSTVYKNTERISRKVDDRPPGMRISPFLMAF